MSASEASMDSDTQQSSEPDQATVLERLGSALREARQSRGLERSALAAKLHMGEEQLLALENGDLARLPEPVFVIAQSRRVADALGVDISLLIAPLKRQGAAETPGPTATRNRSRSSVLPLPVTAPRRTASGSRRSAHKGGGAGRFLGGAALLAGVAAAGLWAWPQLQSQRQRPSTVRQAIQAATSQPKPATQPKQPKVQPDVLLLRASQPSWLEVQGQNQQVLFKGTLQGERRFPIGQGLRVLAGRPDLVSARVGDAAPKPLGSIDQIRWQTIQPSGSAKANATAKAGLKTPASTAPAPAP